MARAGQHTTVVVGDTFDEIVLDPSKDVFLELYAPWCKARPIAADVRTASTLLS